MLFQERFYKSLGKGINVNSSIRMEFPDGKERVILSCTDKLAWTDIVNGEICLREISFSANGEDYRVCGLYGINLAEKHFLYVVRIPGYCCPDTRCHILGYSISISPEGTFAFRQFLDFTVDYNPIDMQHFEYDNCMFITTLGSDKGLHVYELDTDTGVLRRGGNRREIARANLAARMGIISTSSLPLRFLIEKWASDSSQCIVGFVDGHLLWDRCDPKRPVKSAATEPSNLKCDTDPINSKETSIMADVSSPTLKSPAEAGHSSVDSSPAKSPVALFRENGPVRSLLDLVIDEGDEEDEEEECVADGIEDTSANLSYNLADRESLTHKIDINAFESRDMGAYDDENDAFQDLVLAKKNHTEQEDAVPTKEPFVLDIEHVLEQVFLSNPIQKEMYLAQCLSDHEGSSARSNSTVDSTCSIMDDDAVAINGETGSSRHSFLLDGNVSCFQYFSRESIQSTKFRNTYTPYASDSDSVPPQDQSHLLSLTRSPSVMVGMSEGGAVLLSVEKGFQVDSTKPVCLKSLCVPACTCKADIHDHGCVLSICVCDVTGDGYNDVVIGYESGMMRVLALVDCGADLSAVETLSRGAWSADQEIACGKDGFTVDDARLTGEVNSEKWSVDTCEFRDIGHIQLPFPILHISHGQVLGTQNTALCSGASCCDDGNEVGGHDQCKGTINYSYTEDHFVVVTSKSVHVLVPSVSESRSNYHPLEDEKSCVLPLNEKIQLAEKILSKLDKLCSLIS